MSRLLILSTAVFASTACAQIVNYVASAGYSFPDSTPVSPGQVISLFVHGLNVPNAAADTAPWPTILSGVSVVVPNPPTASYPTALPIFSVSSPVGCAGSLAEFCATNIVVQFPYEPICIPNGQPNDCTIGGPATVDVVVRVNGVAGQAFSLSPRGGLHFLNSCDSIYGVPSGACYQLITHADGSLVGVFGLPGVSPAHAGETITIYAVGLGPTLNGRTGQAVSAPDPLSGDVYLTPAVLIGSDLQFGPSIKADWAGLAQGFVGLYQINLQLPSAIPAGIPPCGSAEGGNLRLFFGKQAGQDTTNTAPFTDVCMTTN